MKEDLVVIRRTFNIYDTTNKRRLNDDDIAVILSYANVMKIFYFLSHVVC